MTEQDIAILETATKAQLASWWSELNHYGWPGELPFPEPSEYIANGRRSQIMNWIMKRIGLKECLRDWNKESMTNKQFESWWNKEAEI